MDRRTARSFLLHHHALAPPRSLRGPEGVLAYLRRVGSIQFDPLDVVGHNPELVLQSRVADFRSGMFADLMYRDRLLLEGWDKVMCIYRREDWPHFTRHRAAARERIARGGKPLVEAMAAVRREILRRGPLSSIDIEHEGTMDWDWGSTRVARAALESLYWIGVLGVHHRVHTRRVWDLTERLLPARLARAPDPHADQRAFLLWRVERRVAGLGIGVDRSGEAWLGIADTKDGGRTRALETLAEGGVLERLRIEGVKAASYARRRDLRSFLRAQTAAPRPRPAASILAPLDNILWDRRLVRELFDFDYRWEVYVPVPQRRWGYYVIPLLYGDRLVGRFEPRYDRAERVLTVHRWWWERGLTPDPALERAVVSCFRSFLRYLGADRLRVRDRRAPMGLRVLA